MLSAAVRISQPSLSHAIVQLEQELGVPLFEKNGRNVELTQFGEVFLKQVRQSLEILDGSVDYLQKKFFSALARLLKERDEADGKCRLRKPAQN